MSYSIKKIHLLRNGELYGSLDAAKTHINTYVTETKKDENLDGVTILGRYSYSGSVETVMGIVYGSGSTSHITYLDAASIENSIETLKSDIEGITSGGSGTISQQIDKAKKELIGSTGDTYESNTIYGAKAYAKYYTDDKINNLDVTDTKVNGSFVTAVSETDGKISVSRASIASNDKTITVTAANDGSIDLSANIDGTTILADKTTGKLSVANSALVQYVGSDAVKVSEAVDNKKTISLEINSNDKVLSQSANGLLANVSISYDKENRLIKLLGNNSAEIASIDASEFIKDGMLAGESVFMATATTQSVTIKEQTKEFSGLTIGHHYIVFLFATSDGKTTTYSWDSLDATDIIDVYEAGQGLSLSDDKHTFSVKIDNTTETFLSLTDNGVKLSGVQDAINTAKSDIVGDAAAEYNTLGKLEDKIQDVDKKASAAHTSVNTKTDGHVTVNVETKTSADGISYSAVTVAENDIASATGLTAEITRAKAAEDKIEASVGLNADGSHKTTTGNYTSAATTVVEEIAALDTQVKTNADAIKVNADNIKALEDAKVSVAASTDTESAKYLEVSANDAKTVYTVTAKGIDAAIKVETDRAEAAEKAIDAYVGKTDIPDGKTVMGVIVENEKTSADAINKIANAAGVIDNDDKIAYTAPTVSGEFSTTKSIMDMLNHIDSVWNSIDCGTY
jgi:hypothetical protein